MVLPFQDPHEHEREELNCSQFPVKIKAIDNKCRGNIACSCRGRYPNPELIIQGKTFLYNFEAGALLKASFVSLLSGAWETNESSIMISFLCISSSQRKKNSALKYIEIYLIYLSHTGTMPFKEPSDSNKRRRTLYVLLCKWRARLGFLSLNSFIALDHDTVNFGTANHRQPRR